ncbi:type II toxin-antitoxin system VapC family toxin [Aquisphaera insulae]|uniref:type II toxin-antitoxin system VapC family toxin n=1 Tax=Aquisphaera insulae TaxID=2712864 RepID=UPI0013EDA3A0|nr:PIN domain-containing protein [Aquisphaera insulae]
MRVCLDTNCVIYLVERNPLWAPKLVARLAEARADGYTLAVCDLARSECLIGPLRAGDPAVLADYQRFFSSAAVEMLPLTAAVCERAAEIRVASGLKIKLPDALHLASATTHGCRLFLTNDAQLAACAAIAVEILT